MPATFYWHDYETFGVDPRRDRPAQFAGVRTDEALNEVGEPLLLYCQPAKDMLPHPEACLVNGITPQYASEQGVPEPEFIARIHNELARPETCGVGYNTVRFDDELTRHTLYRNFYDPYAREWQDGNSRWDIIDLVRMTYAFSPEGIVWPKREDGQASFRLGDLAAVNGIAHQSAHDALSDVRATIGLARLIRDRQPRLYDWLYQLRDKRKAAEQLDLIGRKPVLHTASVYASERGCTTLVMPLATEAKNRNSVLVYDLRQDPAPFLNLDVEDLKGLLLVRDEDLPEGKARLPVTSVKTNQCPALAPESLLNKSVTERIALDYDACLSHWKRLQSNENFMQRIVEVHGSRQFAPAEDVDSALYDGFIPDADRPLLGQVRQATPEELAQARFDFEDGRLPELLFRYRARNWPETLTGDEMQRWKDLCRDRLRNGNGGSGLALEEYLKCLARLREQREGDTEARRILDAMEAWAAMLEA